MLFFIQKAGVVLSGAPYGIGRIAARPMLNIGVPILAQVLAKYLIHTPTQEPDNPARIPLSNKRLSCVEVETSRSARPEVQATTITVKPTPGAGGSQWDHERRKGLA
jgi:hypothetical protein